VSRGYKPGRIDDWEFKYKCLAYIQVQRAMTSFAAVLQWHMQIANQPENAAKCTKSYDLK